MTDYTFNPFTGQLDATESSCGITFKNTVQIIKTTVTTTATKINLPEDAQVFRLRYSSVETLWIGATTSVAEDGSESFPVISDEYFYINLKKGNDNELYAIAPTGTIDVYVYAEIEV